MGPKPKRLAAIDNGGWDAMMWGSMLYDRPGHPGPGFDRLEGYVFCAKLYGRSPKLESPP